MPVAAFLSLVLGLCPAQEARDLWSAGRRAEAIDQLAERVAADPADLAARRQLAEWELAVHRYQAALEHLAGLPAEADRLRGLAHYRAGDYESALRFLDPKDGDQALMRIDALEALQRFRESDAALAAARAVLGERDPRLLAAEGRRLARERKFAAAAGAFRAALEADPLDGEALFGLGRALVQAGERDEGQRLLERHRELVPKLDQLDFARRGLDLAPRHAPNLVAVADAERALGRLDRAEALYREAETCATAAELVPCVLRHARLLAEDRKQPDAALALLRASAERAPDPRLHVRAGDLLREGGRPEEAIAAYEAALALRPQDLEIKKRLEAARAGAQSAR